MNIYQNRQKLRGSLNTIQADLVEFPKANELIKLISPVKNVIFDMDGTLINTEALHALAIVNILPKQSISFTKDEIEKHFHGMSDRMVYFKLIELGVIVPFKDDEEFVQAKNQSLISILKKEERLLSKVLKEEIREGLEIIKKEKKQLMLVTASEQIVTEGLLTSMNLKNYFDQIFTAHDTHFTKPNSSPYFLAMRAAGFKTKDHLIFEDSLTGLAAALESGANVIKASWYR